MKWSEMSTEQKERYKANLRARRQERIAWGVCTVCGKQRENPARRLCAECAYKAVLAQIKREEKYTPDEYKAYLARHADWRKNHRKQRIENGLCAACGKKPPVAGQRNCNECRIKVNRLQNKRRKMQRVYKPQRVRIYAPPPVQSPKPNHPWRILNLKTFGKGKLI